MTEIPTWWLVLSGVFFALHILLLVALIYAVYRMIQAIKQVTPKIEAISEKVHEIGEKVEDLTTNVKSTIEALGGRAKSVAGSADLIAHTASRTFEKFSPVVIGILSALRILKAVQEFRAGRSPAEATKAADLEKEGSRELSKVDKRGRK